MSQGALPTKVIAGVSVPDTSLITRALDFANKHSTDYTYNHVVRSLLFGFIIADKLPHTKERDKEAHALAAILHDLGFPIGHPPHSDVISSDNRFEVDGANAAREFLRRETNRYDWDKHRLQLVWDSIALHTIGTVVFHKEPEVQSCSYGIWADFQGPDRVPGGVLTWNEYDTIVKVSQWECLLFAFRLLCFLSILAYILIGVPTLRPDERPQRQHAAPLQDETSDNFRQHCRGMG